MCPLGTSQKRRRRTIDYELDDLYGADHDYNTVPLSDDFIFDHYDQMEERRMNRTADKNTQPQNLDSLGSMRVLNGETGTLPFFVAIRTSTNIHFCGGACNLFSFYILYVNIKYTTRIQ
jgi:pantothenate kinase